MSATHSPTPAMATTTPTHPRDTTYRALMAAQAGLVAATHHKGPDRGARMQAARAAYRLASIRHEVAQHADHLQPGAIAVCEHGVGGRMTVRIGHAVIATRANSGAEWRLAMDDQSVGRMSAKAMMATVTHWRTPARPAA